jgi:hypothetical protein
LVLTRTSCTASGDGTKARLPWLLPSRLAFGAPSSRNSLERTTPPLIEMLSMPPLSNGRKLMLSRVTFVVTPVTV